MLCKKYEVRFIIVLFKLQDSYMIKSSHSIFNIPPLSNYLLLIYLEFITADYCYTVKPYYTELFCNANEKAWN